MGYSDPFYLGSEGIGSGGYWDVDFRAHMTKSTMEAEGRAMLTSYIPGVTKTEGVNHSFPNPRVIIHDHVRNHPARIGLGWVL